MRSKNGSRVQKTDPALLIVGHGSRDPRGAREFHDLVGLVRRRNPSLTVEGGFIELSRPADLRVRRPPRRERGRRRRRRAPDAPRRRPRQGRHPRDPGAREDGPPRVRTSATAAPSAYRPELLELMDERISAVVSEEEKGETAVLLVGRGSSDPDANSDLAKIARLFYEGRPYPLVESAYVSMTPPGVAEGLERCRKLGAKRIVVFSYFLFTGVLEERIRGQSEVVRREPTLMSRCATPDTSDRTRAWLTLWSSVIREAIGGRHPHELRRLRPPRGPARLRGEGGRRRDAPLPSGRAGHHGHHH